MPPITLDYFWGVTPTHLVADAVSSFQGTLTEAMDSVLSPICFDIPQCHVKRHKRAHQVLQLPDPARFGGGNITAQHTLAPAAFLATTCAVLRDPCVANLKGYLAKYVDAVRVIQRHLTSGGGPTDKGVPTGHGVLVFDFYSN